MTGLDALPGRPLSWEDVDQLNSADSVELVVPVDDGTPADRTTSLLVATETQVTALAFEDEWQVVTRVDPDETTRFEALQAAEDAVTAFHGAQSD
ncbi:MAG: hypothetical protein ACQETI_09435 [Halobacteriota archaeon]